MILTAGQGELSAAVSRAAQGLPARPSRDVYAGMLLTSDMDAYMLHLTAGDGEVTFTASLACEPQAYGRYIVPGRLFADVIRALDGQVRLECPGGTLQITSRRARFTLPAVDGDQYPQWPDLGGLSLGDALGAAFPRALRLVAAAASGEAHTPALTAVCLTAEDGLLKMTATDHVRLAYAEIPFALAPSSQGYYGGVITSIDPADVPASALLPASAGERFARDCGEQVWLSWNENLIRLRSPGGEMTARQVQGPYLPWRNVLRKEPPDACFHDLEAAALIRAVRLAQLASGEDNRISLTFSPGEITVSAGASGNECDERVSCAYAGDAVTFLTGARQVLDGLSGLGDAAQAGFTRAGEPLFLRSAGFKYVLQPRREL